jgi:hypothetical protein
MPSKVGDDASGGGSSSVVRLGIQAGAVGLLRQPGFSVGDVYVGGRVFSRYALGSRFYFLPSLGFYRLVSTALTGSGAPNLLDLGAQLHFALFRLGPVSLTLGLNQRLSAEFWTSNGLTGLLSYRLGPGANFGIRFSSSVSAIMGADLTYAFTPLFPPQLSGHGGLLISF